MGWLQIRVRENVWEKMSPERRRIIEEINGLSVDPLSDDAPQTAASKFFEEKQRDDRPMIDRTESST